MCLFHAISAQEQIISGIVCDANKQSALNNANIILSTTADKKIVAYAITSHDGSFRIQFKYTKLENLFMKVSYLGYETINIPLKKDENYYEIQLHPQAIDIKEVVIKAPKIRAQGDTIIYNVASYSKEGDRTIGDVLKKLPGIRVEENGRIIYQGMPINKFYIEGMDLLEGKYGIATNNISNKDVGSIEVLENHQAIKALEGLSLSEQAAINIRLKEKAKLKWIGHLKAGGGITPSSDLLWDGVLIGMRFNKKFQSLSTYKTNNAGVDVTKELHSFDSRSLQYEEQKLSDYIDITPSYPLELDKSRQVFNRTHQVTSNSLFQSKKGIETKVEVNYRQEQEKLDRGTETFYYEANQDTIALFEQENAIFKKQTLSTGVISESNQKNYNLTNKLRINLSWANKYYSIDSNLHTQQNAYSPTQEASNELYILKRTGKNIIILSSYSSYEIHPQQISAIYSQYALNQNINQKKFFTENEISYGYTIGRFFLSSTGGIKGMVRKMDTDIEDSKQINNSQTKSHLNYIHLYLVPKLEYSTSRSKGRLQLSLEQYNYHYADKSAQSKNSHSKFLFHPSLYIEYDLTPTLKCELSGSIKHTLVDEHLFYNGYIMNTYRTFTKGYPQYTLSSQKELSAFIAYKNPLNEFFTRINVQYECRKTPYTLNQLFYNNFLFSSFQNGENTNHQLSITGSLSKGIDWLKGYFFFDAMYIDRQNSLIRNDNKISTINNTWILSPKLEFDALTCMTIKYKLDYIYNTLFLEKDEKRIHTVSFKQKLSSRIRFSSKVSLEVVGEHYYTEDLNRQHNNFFLMDAFLRHIISKDIEVELSAKNLWNESAYSYTSFTDEASTIYRNYLIRPRNIMMTVKCNF